MATRCPQWGLQKGDSLPGWDDHIKGEGQDACQYKVMKAQVFVATAPIMEGTLNEGL